MATQTTTLAPASSAFATDQAGDDSRTDVPYHNPEWTFTIVNYYKDADTLAPAASFSEHQMRVQRRSDQSPNIVKTPVRIRNIQGSETNYAIDTHGFMIGYLGSKMQDWDDDAELRQVYLPEVANLLKRETGAKHVFQYEWHVRSSTLEAGLAQDSTGAVDIKGPVRRVHIDETMASARKEFEYHVQPNKPGNEHLKNRPFGIYNVWKPLKTVRKDPLCLCDPHTVADEDYQVTAVCVPHMGDIENLSLRPPSVGREHGLVYVREQRPEQALIFRICDTRIDKPERGGKRSHGVAHTSFPDPGTEDEMPRQSVEVRSFCIF